MTHKPHQNAAIRLPLLLNVLCIFLLIGSYFFLSAQQPKIGYVNSGDLVNNYIGMKEARNLYQNKSQLWQSTIDTLKLDFNKAVHTYQFELVSLSQEEKKSKERALQQMQQNVLQYSAAIQEKAKQEDEKITQGVLNQVNSFVQEYGQKHGYDVILRTTLSGSLLYGKDKIDITQEIINALKKYQLGVEIEAGMNLGGGVDLGMGWQSLEIDDWEAPGIIPQYGFANKEEDEFVFARFNMI
jgi:outer membrane protein